MSLLERHYYRGAPHPGEIHVHSRDNGGTWEGYRESEWHGVISGEEWYGAERLTTAALEAEAADYRLGEDGAL